MGSDPRPTDRGSVLMLMPAAVLIMVVLGAIAVDRAVVFGAQRELVATAQAAANDAASLGVDIDRLRGDGEVETDLAAMDEAIMSAMAMAEPGTTMTWWVEDGLVVVELRREVELVFAAGVPEAATTQPVAARAAAELRLSDP